VYQHGVSKELMQEVLDSYHARGLEHLQGSLARFRFAIAQLEMRDDSNGVRLAKTLEVINKVYAVYKPQILAARAQYMADHPEWVDKHGR
jgi:predicted nicotinamide N-methyase